MIETRYLGNGMYGFVCPTYSPKLIAACRSTPGMTWNPTARQWQGMYDAVVTAHGHAKRMGLLMGATAKEYVDGFPIVAHPSQLRDYQRQGTIFLQQRAYAGTLLADDVGLGKTCTSIHAAQALGGRVLVVCPSFVRGVWIDNELPRWWPTAKIEKPTGTKPTPIDAATDVIVIHYDILHAWVSAIHEWKPTTVIFDEAHYLQSEKSRRSQAARDIAARCRYRIALSGTPMTSRPKDLWNVVDTISPGRFGKPFAYFVRYCNAHKEEVAQNKVVWKIDGASNLDELQSRLKTFMLRRTKSDVSIGLPPRTRQIIHVDVARTHSVPIGDALKNDQALRKALEVSADGKIQDVVDLVSSHVEAGHNVVVWSHRKKLAESLAVIMADRGYRASVVTGDLPQEKRHAVVKAEPQVLCATMDSLGVGISLDYSDVAVFVELDWVPSKLIQCEGRQGRSSRNANVLIQYVIGRGTADEVIAGTVLKKLDTFSEGIGKLDDGLREDLRKSRGPEGAAGLKRLYEALLAMDEG